MDREPLTATALSTANAEFKARRMNIRAEMTLYTAWLVRRIIAILARRGPGGWPTRDAAAPEEDG